jgi:hypothetical protein
MAAHAMSRGGCILIIVLSLILWTMIVNGIIYLVR